MLIKTLFTNVRSVVIPSVHPNNSFIFYEIILQVSQLCPTVTSKFDILSMMHNTTITSESDILSIMYNTTIITIILARYNPYIQK